MHVAGWQIGYRGLVPQSVLDGLTAAQRLPRWTATLARILWPAQGTLVAHISDTVVGLVDIGPTRDSDLDPIQVGEIRSLYVLPSTWRRGIGRSLLAAATGSLAAAGHSSASLWVLDSNDQAIAFCRAQGWSADGAVKPDVVGRMTIYDLRFQQTYTGRRLTMLIVEQ